MQLKYSDKELAVLVLQRKMALAQLEHRMYFKVLSHLNNLKNDDQKAEPVLLGDLCVSFDSEQFVTSKIRNRIDVAANILLSLNYLVTFRS